VFGKYEHPLPAKCEARLGRSEPNSWALGQKVKSMKFTEGVYLTKKGFRAIGPAHAHEVVRREEIPF
jgi:hypothetical protein